MDATNAVDTIHFSDWIALVGFLSEAEALRYAQLPSETPEATALRLSKALQKAREHASTVSGRLGLKPKMKKLGTNHAARIEKLQAEPTFKEHLVSMNSSEFSWVELRKLKAFQPYLNSEYVDQLVERAPEPGDEEGTVAFCLPLRSERKPAEVVTGFNPNTNTFIVSTGNLDLRIVGQFASEDAATGRRLIGFAYDFGLPQISVVEYKGNYFVKNGYHRAFALLKKGHDSLPCLALSTDSFSATGAQVPGFFPVDLILSDRAPLLSDFQTGAALSVPRRRVRATVSIHGEVQMVTM